MVRQPPLAPGIVVLLEREIRNSLEKRGIQSSYARFRAYAARELESTQDETYAEMSGIGRLCWYRGQEQGYAPSYISYHNSRACGGNFSYVIDYGGEDEYGCGARNRSYLRRGSDGGFLIDRPQRKEDAPAKRLASAKPGNQAAETGSGPSQDKEP